MPALETRNANRDSLYILGTMEIEGVAGQRRAKIRNLSSRGAMAESGDPVVCGSRVTLELREIGKVEGVIAWVEGNRVGIAFDSQIDPRSARPVAKPANDCTDIVRRPAGAPARPYVDGALRAV